MATEVMRGASIERRLGTDGQGSFFDRLVGAWQEYVRYHRTRAELLSLTERELDDIGLSRGDIDGVARRACRSDR